MTHLIIPNSTAKNNDSNGFGQEMQAKMQINVFGVIIETANQEL